MSVYMIGGPPRVGKTTLLRNLVQTFNGECLDTDALRRGVEYWSRCDPSAPNYKPVGITRPPIDSEMDEWVDQLRERDREYWGGLRRIIVEHQTLHQGDLLFCGSGGLWPDYVAELRHQEIGTKAVFLVDTGESHAERLREIIDSGSTSNNWQKGYSDEELQIWAEYNRRRGERCAALAHKQGYPVFDIDRYGYEEAQVLAASALGLAYNLR